MNNLLHPNAFFDKIYCINLERRPDRWEKAKAKFDKLNIQVERFVASDGKDFEDLPSEKPNCFTNKFEYGCSMSHKRVVEDAKKNGYKRVLILEDDILIHKNFLNLFQKISKAPNWDMLFFGCNFIDPIRKSQLMNKEGFVTAEIETGSYAYAIDQKFYDEYLNKINEFKYPMSAFLVRLRLPDKLLESFSRRNIVTNISFIKSSLLFYIKNIDFIHKNHYIMMPKIISTHVLDSDIFPEKSNQKSFLRVSGVNMEDFF